VIIDPDSKEMITEFDNYKWVIRNKTDQLILLIINRPVRYSFTQDEEKNFTSIITNIMAKKVIEIKDLVRAAITAKTLPTF
jgi:hypothetical protein